MVQEKFLNDIIETDSNFKTDDRKLLFISLLTTTNCLILNKLSAFINACFEIRRIFSNENQFFLLSVLSEKHWFIPALLLDFSHDF